MVAPHPSATEVWNWLSSIPDPEIPVLSITDLGIVRDVTSNGEVTITITPTYSGCPAMDVIAEDIRRAAKEHGIANLNLITQLSPAWTTDWMNDDAKARLRDYGIAPPAHSLIQIEAAQPACPHCGSIHTEVVSRFGSTPCKALYKCLSCLEPFDAFKRH